MSTTYETITNTATLSYDFAEETKTVTASAEVKKRLIEPTILPSKQASVSSADTGDVVTYVVTYVISDGDTISNVFFQDLLHPNLAFVEGSLLVDGEPSAEDLSGISFEWLPNSTHTIEYQCTIL